MKYSFVRVSKNSKIGAMPATMTDKRSCPESCPLLANGCYASAGRLNQSWTALEEREKAIALRQLTELIHTLAPGKLWRHNTAGDMTDGSERLDRRAVIELTMANVGKRGFTYTHADPAVRDNARIIRWANDRGFTINLSADTLKEADQLAALQIAPVVTLLPATAPRDTWTPAGRRVVICPHYRDPRIQCVDCGMCQRQKRPIIGFPAHGIQAAKVDRVFHGGAK